MGAEVKKLIAAMVRKLILFNGSFSLYTDGSSLLLLKLYALVRLTNL